ncbi:hypothetical protein F5Y03DRAFT_300867 [Xylaria venustula]|nr:hypothetical protein F5Y03DRAFT_300867 [Xylaria venustula]
MAPTSKGANPAPNYTEAMNRVQTQLEARMRIVRSFMPSRPPSHPTSTFSALASSKPSTTSAAARQTHDAESLFAETRAQDPNAGLGFGTSSKKQREKEKERSDQLLRSRLLGRKRGAENGNSASLRRGAREESSDEEPGRSGLGRAKKRARREESPDEEKGEGGEQRREIEQSIAGSEGLVSGLDNVGTAQPKESKDEDEDGDEDVDMKGAQNSVPDGATSISDQNVKKRRKKRKKKKQKSKSEEAKSE